VSLIGSLSGLPSSDSLSSVRSIIRFFRTQLSAGHETHHLNKALNAFVRVGKKFDILGRTKAEIIERYGL